MTSLKKYICLGVPVLFLSCNLFAEQPDPAYIKAMVNETIAGAQQNQRRFKTEDIKDVVAASDQNRRAYEQDAQSLNNHSKNYLSSPQAQADQKWAQETMRKHESSPEFKKHKRDAYETCLITQRYAPVNCEVPE
ncbi:MULTISPECIES: hypothetical protein [Acinetobacter]|jgi:hypothetical protein|uniref:Uncharacterized protein n=1 Tax=Acinetobacter baumannii TaxID=470 RepID=A0A0H4UVG7_ACIBA|nr:MULTISPECIES: hypothetical protein [Acinetobacter]AKQ32615.1 hypothetical protein ACX61_19695 [Acinetobacter baumannii]ALG88290.1 hypothetical protein [Acinetobacter baumannii]AMQ95700.1 hypothetical protein [Acinetobacter baumannii]ASS85439.1 hypothetical protein [Acinetobacter baumannii]EHU1275419.1 hypothetical protein [Acinetobacter baumannii]